ncbi:hypothetical protein SUGI_0201150 [Cryptomeria japonica]|uniref:cyclic nucleotide-gated ion channel 2 n=1 Tax=Cryptomeria japonica TaxID=3369 RepID=UPI002408AF85|nr:cyclic nucleotide-gated ion channel 2 [Cryptomeria japonica]GLJ12938.1 hypothetical protein SUGI_0201150 [Cryptomeria japonica]
METARTIYSLIFKAASGWISRTSRTASLTHPEELSQRAGEDSTLEVVTSPALSRSGNPSEECFACTQAQTPAFHSITCDEDNDLLWEANAGSSIFPTQCQQHMLRQSKKKSSWIFGSVLDPRSKEIQRWNRTILLVSAIGLAIDPLFFYVLSISKDLMCLYIDGKFAVMVAVLRSTSDAMHLYHIWLQLKLAYVSKESLVVGCGKLVWDARSIALHYLKSLRGFWFDILVILPVPQMVFWLVIPDLIKRGQITPIMTVLLLIFLFQYLPKVYHSVCLMRRMQRVTGYVFGTVWWGFGLNLIAYFIASHVAGGCWYVLAIQRVATCLKIRCEKSGACELLMLGCSKPIAYSLPLPITGEINPNWSKDETLDAVCFSQDGPVFHYGIYKWALPLVTSSSWSEKILYPIFWGLMTLSTFGNDLEPTCHWLEVVFSIVIVLSGLLLFTLLIGNIQVFLHAVMQKKRLMQLKIRDLEWWMRRRQLPTRLRHRVRHYERQRWAATRGVDETEMISDLPEGLRRDIKRHLCIDLIRQVPLFDNMDDLILDNICDRVKPLLFTKGEKILREGDPVQRMLYIVRGHLQSSQRLSKGLVSTCMLGPGNFCGDELLSWCLRKPFLERLPPSSATFTSLEATEAFGLDAQDLKYVTEHFRYKFANERLKRTARYYSSSWRTWAAVTIQLSWRKHKARAELSAENNIVPAFVSLIITNPVNRSLSDQDRLRLYAAMFMSPKPNDHLE